jgi:hypothetical protein
MDGDGGEVETRDDFTDAALLRTLTRESSRTVEMRVNDQGKHQPPILYPEDDEDTL